MKKAIHTFLKLSMVTAIVLGLSASAQAQALELRALDTADFAARELVQLPAEKGLMPGVERDPVERDPVERDPVDFSYALDSSYAFNGESNLLAAPQAFVAESREYFVDVDAASMARGVTVYTTAPGALLRINPAAGEKIGGSLDPNGLVIKDAAGVEYRAAEALDAIVSAEQLKATGVPFVEGTVAFRLAPAVGVGAITIAAPGFKANSRLTVHVFDQASPIALKLAADRVDYLHGDQLRVEAAFAGAPVKLGAARGFITSPAGRAWPLEIAADGESLVGSVALDAVAAPGAGLWQVHLAARGTADGLDVVRSVRTAFAAHLPTARLDAAIERVKVRDGLALRFGVEVGTPGRYEVRGVLYATDASGSLVPMSIGHAADWLDASGALVLRFPAVDGLGAPYELRDLRLLDQGRMGVLHRQARALTLGR